MIATISIILMQAGPKFDGRPYLISSFSQQRGTSSASANEPLVSFVHAKKRVSPTLILLFRFVDKVFCVALLRLECLVHAVSV